MESGDPSARGRASEDDAALRRAATAALRARGAEVRVFAGADNSVRPRAAGDAGALPFVVEVEGTPNLLHELAHVVLLGRVAKDHATDYARLPYDMTTADGRKLLFEELACCSASCAWHPGGDAAARAWFEEQVTIQDCFFGKPGELAPFLAGAAREVEAHAEELRAIERLAVVRVEAALREAGMTDAAPRREFGSVREMRAICSRIGTPEGRARP